jgi:uncharacterized protein YqeY
MPASPYLIPCRPSGPAQLCSADFRNPRASRVCYKELAIIESYLPAGASEAEMNAAITKAISETGANSIKQMGGVVKAAKAALEGKSVDGKALSDLVRDRLSKLG